MKPHIVLDAAFASESLINEINDWGGTVTSSFPIDTLSCIWNLLGRNLPPNHWRCSTNSKVVASIHWIITKKSHKMKTQQIVSTGFKVNPISLLSPQTTELGNKGKNKF